MVVAHPHILLNIVTLTPTGAVSFLGVCIVALVAVAVNAIMFTCEGTRPLAFPMARNSF